MFHSPFASLLVLVVEALKEYHVARQPCQIVCNLELCRIVRSFTLHLQNRHAHNAKCKVMSVLSVDLVGFVLKRSKTGDYRGTRAHEGAPAMKLRARSHARLRAVEVSCSLTRGKFAHVIASERMIARARMIPRLPKHRHE